MRYIIEECFTLHTGCEAKISLVKDTKEIFVYEWVERPFVDNGGIVTGLGGTEMFQEPTWEEVSHVCLHRGDTAFVRMQDLLWIKIEVS